MADLDVISVTSRVLAAHNQCVVFQSGNENDAAVLLECQLVGALGPCEDVLPLGLMNLVNIEELVVASHGDFWLVSSCLGSEEAARICGQITSLVIPVLQAPGVDLDAIR